MISYEQAKQFLNDYELGDILAITNMKRDIDKNSKLYIYLDSLDKLNAIMTSMEMLEIDYEVEFYDLYRQAMTLLYNKCKNIVGGE